MSDIENLDIIPAHRHHRYNIDFTYSFDSVRNNTLDHFILSGMLYENCIRAVTVLHDLTIYQIMIPYFFICLLKLNTSAFHVRLALHVLHGKKRMICR